MQELLAEGDFVRALARQLIGSADGDDLAQDTWLTALRHGHAVQRPRAWLARITARLAANRRRADRRRVAREQRAVVMRPAMAPSTDEIVACEQVRQRVVAAVLALEDPYRATLLARFYECLDTPAIAARDGVEEATVRTRLKRGLERLRVGLDGQHGVRAAWVGPLGLLARDPVPSTLPVGAAASAPHKLAVAAFVLLAAFATWQAWPEAPAVARHDAAVMAPLAAATGTANEAPPPPQDAVRASAPAAAPSFDPPRERLPWPVRDEPIDDVVVRVLDITTRKPVAGAEVVFQAFSVDVLHPQARADRVLREMLSSDSFVERFGSRTRTGADGSAAIRLPRSGASVIASHGDRWVRAHVAPGTLLPGEQAPLWLDDPRWIRLRLVDASSGAPVAGELVYVSDSETQPVVAASCGYGGHRGPSDADGMIRMPWARDRTPPSVHAFTVGPSTRVKLDLPAALERVTDVPRPATGSMTVELRTPSGALWPGAIDATISHGDSMEGYPWRQWEPGVYRIPHVQVGLTWTVRAQTQSDGTPVSAVAVGPRAAGEDVVVTLRAATEPCVVRARLRLADGSLPPRNVQAHVRQAEGKVERERAWSYLDEAGGLTWTIDSAQPAFGAVTMRDSWSNTPLWQGAWRLDSPPAPGEHDLGTLTLEQPALVVSGEFDVGAGPWCSGPLTILCEQQADNGAFERFAEVAVDAVRTRCFELRGVTRAANVRLSVRTDRHVLESAPVVVRTGARDVRLAVGRGFPLRARVLAPPAYARAVTCRVAREDGAELPAIAPLRSYDEPSPRSEGSLADFDGEAATFAWPALPGGSYRVEVFAPGLAPPLVVVPGVRVGEGAPDPRLDPIDARQRTRTLTVAVEPLAPGSRPITDGGVLAFPSGKPARTLHGLLFDARGEARLLVGPDPVDVVVAVPGHRLWQRQRITEASLRVQLEPCLHARVQLAPRVAECFAGHRVEVCLEPCHRDDGDETVCFLRPGDRRVAVHTPRGSLQRLDGDGRAVLDARATGAVPISDQGKFKLWLLIDGGVVVNESWNHWQKSPLEPSEIDVRGADDPVVVIDCDPKVLNKVAEELSRRR
ncbi:MAG TPA: sigma-70 family RNA polymerase sigma factor [Planctomycetota bacterium]